MWRQAPRNAIPTGNMTVVLPNLRQFTLSIGSNEHIEVLQHLGGTVSAPSLVTATLLGGQTNHGREWRRVLPLECSTRALSGDIFVDRMRECRITEGEFFDRESFDFRQIVRRASELEVLELTVVPLQERFFHDPPTSPRMQREESTEVGDLVAAFDILKDPFTGPGLSALRLRGIPSRLYEQIAELVLARRNTGHPIKTLAVSFSTHPSFEGKTEEERARHIEQAEKAGRDVREMGLTLEDWEYEIEEDLGLDE